ncbi:MAG: Gfo/Idh/MocA family oxidoreductase [Planctomycetota bacterium]|nr:Gfo/Idh/MocA family oxidoreductase [Planctomycetota bacterium]
MNPFGPNGMSRRDLLKTSGTAAAVSALATLAVPKVHAADSSEIRIALVGAGGRGTGAAGDAMNNSSGPVKLVAMADVFENRLSQSYQGLKNAHNDKVDVPEDNRYVGLDAYKKAMDCLRPGDVVILATPPAFRWVHFGYAIDKGLNVFMEKPIAVDGPSTRKMLKLGEDSVKKNLKVGVGLMCRHCRARGELSDRIRNGEIGDIVLMRAYRAAGPTGSAFVGPRRDDENELDYQIRNFHGFLWLSGGAYSDFLIHNIDECCWMKDAWPIEAKGFGGRHYRGDSVDQNFDVYSTEYTFADGSKMMLEGRCMIGCYNEFATYVHGTKGSAVVSASGHMPSKCRIYKNQSFKKENIVWQWDKPEPNPYQMEWNDLIAAIINDKPYNEVERGAKSSLVTAMGRTACHTGQIVTYDEMLNHEHELAPNLDTLTSDSPAPLLAMKNGKYPVPQPGINTRREF